MKYEFNLSPIGEYQIVVTEKELFVLLPLLVVQVNAFEVIDLQNDSYLVKYRSYNDKDHELLAEWKPF